MIDYCQRVHVLGRAREWADALRRAPEQQVVGIDEHLSGADEDTSRKRRRPPQGPIGGPVRTVRGAMRVTTWLVLAPVLLALGCAARPSAAQAPAPGAMARTIGYWCPDQSGFQASIAAARAGMALEGLASGPVTLTIAPSASGARYTDGTTTFWSKGADATLEGPGDPSRACTAVADPGGLPGTRWRLVRIELMNETAVVPADPSRYTLEFGAGGALSGQADCNRLRGRWTASGTSMSLGPFATTRAMCPAGSLSDRYARLLETAATWMIVDDRLTIAMKMDTGILHFERML